MTCRNKLFSILLFSGMFFLNAPPVQAQACKQAVYLLRHAEDQDEPKQLSENGMQHAELYAGEAGLFNSMIDDFGTSAKLCTVQAVFAMWDRQIDGTVQGTTNPFYTAKPLARNRTAPPFTQPNPSCPTPVDTPPGYTPEMCFLGDDGQTYFLCEFAKNDPGCSASGVSNKHNALFVQTGMTRSPLYLYLMKYLAKNTQYSVAIFYTKDGMPDVSRALNVDTLPTNFPSSQCPTCWPGTSRASVNIFTLAPDKTDPTKRMFINTDFFPNPPPTTPLAVQPTQCFAITRGGPHACQTTGNLDDSEPGQKPPVPLPTPVSGVFCAKTTKMRDPKNVFYGSCPATSTSANPAISPHDLDANMVSDIIWRDTSGDIAVWLMNAAGVASTGGLGNLPTTWSIVGQRDFDGNGTADLLWRDTSGNTSIWFMSGTAVASSASVGNIPMNWTVIATGDFNGDGMGDILWQDASGNLSMWLMNGATVLAFGSIGNVPANWSLVGTGDFDGDGNTDLFWRDNLGNNAIWFMNGTTIASTAGLGNIPTTWTVVGIGDFDGKGKSDVVWRDGSGNT
jgi:hypothetical protein